MTRFVDALRTTISVSAPPPGLRRGTRPDAGGFGGVAGGLKPARRSPVTALTKTVSKASGPVRTLYQNEVPPGIHTGSTLARKTLLRVSAPSRPARS